MRLIECRNYDPGLNAVYGKLLAEVYFRLDAAMQGFFRRLEAGEKAGFPRVRPRHQFFTLCYPAAYLLFEGKQLMLPTGGKGRNKRLATIQRATVGQNLSHSMGTPRARARLPKGLGNVPQELRPPLQEAEKRGNASMNHPH